VPKPRELYDGLEEHVIGQHRVKVALSVGVHNHYKRVADREKREREQEAAGEAGDKEAGGKEAEDKGPQLDKSNIILLGPTGSVREGPNP
jgi:ATP-dependent Clp protease ATP-binding subunit ClpX